MGSYEVTTSLGLLRPKLYTLVVLLVLLSFSGLLALSGCGKDDQGVSQGSGQGGSGFSDDTVRRLDAAIAKRMQENDLPGVVVGVWVPGEGEYVVARGKANLRTGEKRDLGNPFRIGSITKTFTATAVSQLVEEGKLSKNDKLSKWYPDFPNAEKITIEHLLRMQSGIVMPEGEPEQYSTTEEVIEGSAKQGIVFGTPGQRTEYSDINYILLGEIIRKVSGNDTGDQLTQTILKPLGLKHTIYSFNNDFNDLPGDLHGYTLDLSTGELKDAPSLPLAPVGAAGAMISDLSDLKTWAKAVCTGKLLKPETQKAHLQTQYLSGGPDFAEYGEGIMKMGEFCGHPGIQPGFNSQMWYLPEKDATIIVNVNRFDPSAPPPAVVLFETITKILFPKYVEW